MNRSDSNENAEHMSICFQTCLVVLGGGTSIRKQTWPEVPDERGAQKMLKKQFHISLVAFFAVGLILMGSAMHAVAQNTLKIGAIWGLSGPGSQIQIVMRDAAILATEWINSKGGITVGGEKYKIELLIDTRHRCPTMDQAG